MSCYTGPLMSSVGCRQDRRSSTSRMRMNMQDPSEHAGSSALMLSGVMSLIKRRVPPSSIDGELKKLGSSAQRILRFDGDGQR